MSPQAAIGGIMVLSAVFIGSYTKKRTSRNKNKTEKKDLLIGIITGCFSVILLAIGIVMIKEILEQTDVFWATFVRVAAGIVSLLIIVVFHPKRKQYLDELKFFQGMDCGAAGLCMREFYRTAFLGGRNEIHHCLTGGDFKPDVHHIYFYSCGCFFKRKDYGKQEYCHCRCRDRCLPYDLWIARFQQALIF